MSTPIQNGICQDLELVPSRTMVGDHSSISQDIRFFQMGSMQVTWSGNDAIDGYFRPQVSIDQTNWCDLLSSSSWANTSLSETCAFYAFDVAPFPYFRVFYQAGSNTAGTFSVRTFFKKMNTGG